MKRKLSVMFAITIILSSSVCAEVKPIKVLYTSAIIPKDYESRKECYIRNLQLLKQYGCDVYVVESCQTGPTFLDEFCDHVCYTQSNDPTALPSYNEAHSMAIGLQHFNFDPDEMIIKVTGRYVLEKDEFISLVRNNLDADVIARKWDDLIYEGGVQPDAYTGCFAAKTRCLYGILDNYFKRSSAPYKVGSEFHLYAIEWALGDYIVENENSKKIVYLPKLYDYLSEVCHRR